MPAHTPLSLAAECKPASLDLRSDPTSSLASTGSSMNKGISTCVRAK